MKYSKELKVGIAIILSVVVFVLGVRYFDDLPLFRGTYALRTSFADAGGLLSGGSVRVNGVEVGKIEQVRLDPATQRVEVDFHVDSDLKVPTGSFTRVAGIEALGNVQMELVLGPQAGAPVPEDGFVPSREDEGLSGLMDRAPTLVNQADSVMIDARLALRDASITLRDADRLLSDPNSDLRLAFVELRGVAATLNATMRAEQARISRTLANLEQFSGQINRFGDENMDSVAAAVQGLNRAMNRLNTNLASLEHTTAQLDEMVGRVNAGEGTLGRLVADDSLYQHMDSAAVNLNRILEDFRRKPGRYLRDLRLIDIF